MTRTWEDNARDFGGLIRQDKDFRLAALVACSVERAINRYSVSSETLKCSMAEFARNAEVSTSTVTRYMRNWEAMASEGLVPDPDTLAPSDVDSITPTVEAIERWEEMPTNQPPMPAPINREPVDTMHAMAQPVPFDRVRVGFVRMADAIKDIANAMALVNDPAEIAVFRSRANDMIEYLNELLSHEYA